MHVYLDLFTLNVWHAATVIYVLLFVTARTCTSDLELLWFVCYFSSFGVVRQCNDFLSAH